MKKRRVSILMVFAISLSIAAPSFAKTKGQKQAEVRKNVVLDLYYMRQNDSRSETQHVNAIGASLAFYF